MFLSADLTMTEATGVSPVPWLDGMAMPVMVVAYLSMIGLLVWADAQPTVPRETLVR